MLTLFLLLSIVKDTGTQYSYNYNRILINCPLWSREKPLSISSFLNFHFYAARASICLRKHKFTWILIAVAVSLWWVSDNWCIDFNMMYLYRYFFILQRAIDKTRVTCVQWVPSVRGQFIVSYASGSMYIYNHELQCPTLPPTYQVFKQVSAWDQNYHREGPQIGLELSHFTSYILSKTQRFTDFYTFLKSFQIVCMW